MNTPFVYRKGSKNYLEWLLFTILDLVVTA
jgi:hypothetical protein